MAVYYLVEELGLVLSPLLLSPLLSSPLLVLRHFLGCVFELYLVGYASWYVSWYVLVSLDMY